MYDQCITCQKWIAEWPEPFCSEACKRVWYAEQAAIEEEIERERDERMRI